MQTLLPKRHFYGYDVQPFCLRICICVFATVIAACGGSGGGGGAPENPVVDNPATPPTLQPGDPSGDTVSGRLSPVPIGGLSFRTATQSGVTNALGEYHYQEGETIEFSLGGTVVGVVGASQELSLFDLQSAEPLTDVREALSALEEPSSQFTAAANLTRLLYTLDDDQNLDNGIGIAPETAALLDTISLNFAMQPRRFAYANEVQTLLESTGRQLMPLEVSLAHQYARANLLLVEDGVVVGQPTSAAVQIELGGILATVNATNFAYDSLGNLIRRENVNELGLVESVSVFEYDNAGLRTQRSDDFDGDGQIDALVRYEYNLAGDQVQAIRQDNTGAAPASLQLLRYNELGQEVETTFDNDGDGAAESRVLSHYASNGRISRTEFDANADGVFERVISNSYNDNAQLIEQTFEGTGFDEHDFRDNQPPPIGVSATPIFAPTLPYWTVATGFLAPVSPVLFPTYRQTQYLRDDEGRVIERRTDRNRDGIPDQIAQLEFDTAEPVVWRYDSQGDGSFESQAIYSYDAEGTLTRADETQVLPNGVATATRRIQIGPDEPGRRSVLVTTTSNGVRSIGQDVQYIFNSNGQRTRRVNTEGQEEFDVTTWQASYRLDDALLYPLLRP